VKYTVRNNYFNLLFAATFIAVGSLFYFINQYDQSLNITSLNIENEISSFRSEIDKIVNDSLTVKELSNQFSTNNQPRFNVLIFENEKLVYWNNNEAIPIESPRKFAFGERMIQLKNGYYLMNKKQLSNKRLTLIALLPVYYQYVFDNQFLKNEFNKNMLVPDKYTFNQFNEGTEFKSENGNYLFSIDVKSSNEYAKSPILTNIFFLIAIVFLLIYFTIYCRELILKGENLNGFFLFTFIIAAILTVINFTNFPPGLRQTELFNPALYGSSILSNSLGSLFIRLILLTWLGLFAYFNIRFSGFKNLEFKARFIILVLLNMLLFAFAFLCVKVIRSLVIDSSISYDILSLINFDLSGLVAILCVILSLCLFLVLYQIIFYIKFKLRVELDFKMIAFLLAFCLYFSLLYFTINDFSELIFASILVLTLFFLDMMFRKNPLKIGIVKASLLITIMCIFASFLLYTTNINKEKLDRRNQAYSKSLGKDPQLELTLSNLSNKIKNDPFITRYFSQPYLPVGKLEERLQVLYLKNIVGKYDVNIYPVKENSEDRRTYTKILSKYYKGVATIFENLRIITNVENDYNYINKIVIQKNNKVYASIYLEVLSKSQNSLYPKLLVDKNFISNDWSEDYSQAIYKRNNLVSNRGDFSFPTKFDTYFPAVSGSSVYLNKDGYSHLVSENGLGANIVISKIGFDFASLFSLFSFLFLLVVIFVSTLILIVLAFHSFNYGSNFTKYFIGTFRRRINFSMALLLTFSFILTGVVIIVYFTGQFKDYHQSRLERKQQAIQRNFDNIFANRPLNAAAFSKKEQWEEKLKALSTIHAIDINLYNSKGDLNSSSQPYIFEFGLLSNKMNATAYNEFFTNNEDKLLHTERIGQLDYLSSYFQLKDRLGRKMAIINLPYYATTDELQNDLNRFLLALINVYVVLFILGTILALTLSENLTKSLTSISRRIQSFRFGKKHDPLTWRYNDEIGSLVSVYNEMIEELEDSADLLAKSERQSAWREMARQVAHEIKNPLTPMKLSIQHLQRALKDGADNTDVLAKKVTNTLIEQIDNLTNIASEFSAFAKMPDAKNEVFEIRNTVQSVVDLFQETKDVRIDTNLPNDDCLIYGDKNQLMRVFNNLIQNAIQAKSDFNNMDINVDGYKNAKTIKLSFKDNGSGIADEIKNKVFVPNFTTKGSGMGLGLAISKQIVENAGGEISFTSEVNKGTTFLIELPLYSDKLN